ncbi:glycosyl transferase, partial [Bifidobacteriaceae bacterium WP022]
MSNMSASKKITTNNATSIDKLAIVVVTYKRQELLENLFHSFECLKECPWRIVVVDNECSDKTGEMVARLEASLTNRW